ncbi:DUF3103 family protein [Streptomyces sp. NPDC058701]|uniref:DUF3103 family protein n=1 Tax=Streptomyces sp. NPDC058701 TaxID=3346608 RepID=UPI0036506DE3
MMRSRAIGTLIAVLSSAAVLSGGMPAMASPTSAPETTQDVVMQAKEDAAKRLATAFTGGLASETRTALDAGDAIALSDVTSPNLRSYASAIAADNAAILQAKGLPDIGNIMEVRLANPETRSALAAGTTPLIAAEPGDHATTLTAIRPDGTTQVIDGAHTPSTPVLVVGYDGDKAMSAGMRILDDGFKSAWPDAAANRDTSNGSLTSGKTVTQIKNIYLDYDEEPWFKGGAEIFLLTSGAGKNGKPFVSGAIKLPFLDNDKTGYKNVNVTAVDWSQFGWDDASITIHEEDDGTDYKAITSAMVTAVGTLANWSEGATVVNTVLAAIPGDWWKDGTDDIDQYFSVSHNDGISKTERKGAGGNARILFANKFIPQI